MQIGQSLAAALASCSLAFAQGGFSSPESPGIVVTGDFDSDGCDDVLVLGVRGRSQTYYGSKVFPFFRKGPQWFHTGFMSLGDAPLFVGKHLYLPVLDSSNNATVEVYRHSGSWALINTIYPFVKKQGAWVNSIKITGLGKDVNSDQLEDILMAWGEAPLSATAAYHAAYACPTGIRAAVTIGRDPSHHPDSQVADVHRSQSIANATSEFLITLTAPFKAVRGGFGFLVLDDGPKAGKTIWAGGLPPLDNGGMSPSNHAVAYGHFGLMPQLGAPMVKLDTGESIVFEPWFVQPYVRNRGEVIRSNTAGALLDGCTGDYDGDGVDEVVLVESFGLHKPSLFYVADPSSRRPYAHAEDLWIDHRHTSPYVFHGAKGDFNGDGALDLVLSYGRGEFGRGEVGYLALFVNSKTDAAGSPLRRVH